MSSTRSRAVVARFERFGDREAVMRNARKLKGTDIFIDEDLCQASQQIRKNQIPQMKKARDEGKIAFFKYTKLIIKDKSTGNYMTHARNNENRPGNVGSLGRPSDDVRGTGGDSERESGDRERESAPVTAAVGAEGQGEGGDVGGASEGANDVTARVNGDADGACGGDGSDAVSGADGDGAGVASTTTGARSKNGARGGGRGSGVSVRRQGDSPSPHQHQQKTRTGNRKK